MKAEIKKTASRFRHTIGKYRVQRGKQCKSCSGCVVTCPHGVHFKAGTRMGTPRDYLCVGPDKCKSQDCFCVEKCPNQALNVVINPQIKALGRFPLDSGPAHEHLVSGRDRRASRCGPGIPDRQFRGRV